MERFCEAQPLLLRLLREGMRVAFICVTSKTRHSCLISKISCHSLSSLPQLPAGAKRSWQATRQRQLLGRGVESHPPGAPQEAEHGSVAPRRDHFCAGPGPVYPPGSQAAVRAPCSTHQPSSTSDAPWEPLAPTGGSLPTQAGLFLRHRFLATQPQAAKLLRRRGRGKQRLLGQGRAASVFTAAAASLRLLCSQCVGQLRQPGLHLLLLYFL